jgi:hypothetical protein
VKSTDGKKRIKSAPKKPRIVAIELKIHRTFLYVYVKRDRDSDGYVTWKVYQHVTKSSVRRLAQLAMEREIIS